MKLKAYDIADRLGLHRPHRNVTITNVVTDSRQVKENTLFAALVGERTDGHNYIPELDKKFKNVMFLTSHPVSATNDVLVCKDVLRALADIAALHLESMSAKRVAVTGSVGKTTTKEMIDCVLSSEMKVQKSLANRNNELGMPLTAFTVTSEHQAAIFEMGMRGKGQIDYLARRVKPNVGVITNIGVSHIELLGSRENICDAKMELASHIGDGVLLLNGDEPLLRKAAEKIKVRHKFFGIDEAGDYRATDIVVTPINTKYTLHYQDKSETVTLTGTGKHLVYDSLAAIAVGIEMGVSVDNAIKALGQYVGQLRQRIFEEGGYTVIDDTYNAAPESMQAALGVLGSFESRKVAVLADMLELGDYSEQAHIAVGESCRDNGVDVLICYGEFAPMIAKGYNKSCQVCVDGAEALEKLKSRAVAGDVILFKGSHSMQCDVLMEEFLKTKNTRN